ncbi:hypothetical protein [Vibrio maerlii]|uniref:hypothetical protein n=1 Tax=Vibrio maerlii TaxID=2231648 RepID=UPI000E3B6592|nr:hypothetical protein [Vibrio maerlii]
MHTPHRRDTLFKWSLILVLWVVVVCLAKNVGFVTSCPNQAHQDYAFTTQSTAESEQCDLSEKLLSAHQHQVDSQAIFLFIFALVLVTWLLSTPNPYYLFTEPIAKRRRVHLTLCVFRE